jgi:nucleoside-diphosphate-sugar epimerase
MTSTPTKAMLAAAVGRPYHISFGGTAVYHHADDAAAVFIKAARTSPSATEAPVYNLGGNTATMSEIVAGINAAAPAMAGQITFEALQLATPTAIDDSALNTALGPIRWRPLAEGVQQTVEHLRRGVAAGKVNVEKILA